MVNFRHVLRSPLNTVQYHAVCHVMELLEEGYLFATR